MTARLMSTVKISSSDGDLTPIFSFTPLFALLPLLNVAFLLFLFFAVLGGIDREEKLLGVVLPTAKNGQSEFGHHQRIVANLTANGEIYVEGRKFAPEALGHRLSRLAAFMSPASQPIVIIRADAACAHRDVTAILDLCANAGIHEVYFSTQPR